MKKSIYIWAITTLIVMFSLSLSTIAYMYHKHKSNVYEIPDESTALEMGATVLKETFPDYYEKVKSTLTAKKENDIWIVHNNHPQITLPDGKVFVTYGGIIYVNFSAKDGTVIDIGMWD